MSPAAIAVEQLGKKYRIGSARPNTLRDRLAHLLAAPLRRRRAAAANAFEFWALRDVSFEIQPGEVVGVIGRNGAGKSTLLKVLSRITDPTTGRVAVRGRVASLLEVGTGFHPELTGRENIFLNGAILGMTGAEIKTRFDEIVAFAEVERFLDTPVKHYSSGMYVRLAFSVAAHLDPEILIVDEVLAVGDTRFQQKCLAKMGEASTRSGRTVLLVSHNLSAVRNLCSRALHLEQGRLVMAGTAEACIANYLQRQGAGKVTDVEGLRRTGDGRIRFTGFWTENAAGEVGPTIASGESCTLVFRYRRHEWKPGQMVDVGFGIHAATGERLLVLYASNLNQEFSSIHEEGEFRCVLPALPLATGQYSVIPRIEINGSECDFPQDPIGWIDVAECDFYGTGRAMGSRGLAPYLTKGQWSERGVGAKP